MMADLLSICIIGNDTSSFQRCIDHASKHSSKVLLYLEPDVSQQYKESASGLGARLVDKKSLSEVLETEWILFLKPNEKFVPGPGKILKSILRDTSPQGYFVHTKSDAVKHLIDNYQLIKNLQQYKDVSGRMDVTILEPRLATKPFAEFCLECLTDEGMVKNPDIAWDEWQTAAGLSIDPIPSDLVDHAENERYEENEEEHDKRCLKGEITYGLTREEGIYELSSHYIGFRVMHERYIEGFLESANHGFGTDNMYLPMLRYLNKNGRFDEAKGLFEKWIRNRDGDESADVYKIGGSIYAHLFLLDEAIASFKRAVEIQPDPANYATLGKIYLIHGERDKAVTFLEKSVEMRPAPFHEHILSLINTGQWQPSTLSLCMIARDEEHTIGRAIESMKNIADETIVVDTGSKDGTKNIAAASGSKVIETDWKDDFSAVRNDALKEARGDYVFILDSDEFIDIRDRLDFALLKKILPQNKDVAFSIKIEHDKSSFGLIDSLLNKLMKQEPVDWQVRLFPRREDISFANAAFESVECSLRRAKVKIVHEHLFKITHDKDKAFFRDERKLQAVRNSFFSLDRSQTALKGGLFFLKRSDLEQGYYWLKKVENEDPVLLSRIAALYASQNLDDQAEEIINRALNYHQDSPELQLILARILYKKEQYAKACDVLGKLVHSRLEGVDPELFDDAFFYYGMALLETGQFALGTDLIAQTLERDPLDMRFQIGGLYAFAKSDQWEEFLNAAARIVHDEKIKIDFEIDNYSDIGHLMLKLFRHYRDTGRQDEALICQKILTHLIYRKMDNKNEIEYISIQIEKIVRTI